MVQHTIDQSRIAHWTAMLRMLCTKHSLELLANQYSELQLGMFSSSARDGDQEEYQEVSHIVFILDVHYSYTHVPVPLPLCILSPPLVTPSIGQTF